MRGGKRKGAGRKKGSSNKERAQYLADAKAAGELPHEFLLRVTRGEKIGEYVPSFDERMKAAVHAAPFFAPRLANVAAEVSGPNGGAIVTRIERVIVDPKT